MKSTPQPTAPRRQPISRGRKLAWAGVVVLLLIGLGIGFWVHRFHDYTPAVAMKDIRAATGSKSVEQFMQKRYGAMTEAANREEAFLDFFEVGHVEGLRIVVSHLKPAAKEKSIAAMARWIAEYRRTLSPDEKEALRNKLNSEAGRVKIKQATAQYLSQDVRYRSDSAVVVRELMTTLTAIQQP
ncbi:MAG: hypothetical protein WCO56_07620 [Verrucomicrobiota bacterium]